MKSFKRILSLLLVILALIPMICTTIPVSAAVTGTCGNELTWTLESGTLTVSGSGKMSDFYFGSYYNNVPWRSNRSSVQKVVVEEGVTHIGDNAFRSCNNLVSISIAGSVRSIGGSAFYNCTSLKEVDISDISAWCSLEKLGSNPLSGSDLLVNGEIITELVIPDDVETIRSSAFRNCNSISSVRFGKNVKSVGVKAFYGCPNLSNLTFNDSLSVIEEDAFYECSSLLSVCFNDSLTTVGESAFSWCTSLSEVTFNDSLQSIEGYAFYNTAVTAVNLPATVNKIDRLTFGYCPSLTEINIDPENQTYSSDSGVLFSKDGSTLFIYPCGRTDAEYSVPGYVTKIEDNAFAENMYLESIKIPEGVTEIGDYAFYRSASLKSAELPDNLKTIGEASFAYCKNLKDVDLPGSLVELGSEAFMYTAIESICIPESIEYIKYGVFFECNELKNVELCYGIKIIGSEAFAGCSALESIVIPDSVTELHGAAFESTALKNVKLSENIIYFANTAFDGTPFYNDHTDPEDPTIEFGDYFIGLYPWKEDYVEFGGVLGSNVKCIATYAFYGETNLKTFYIPQSVRGIGSSAFSGCKNLTRVNIPEGIETLYNSLFYGCESLTSITIPDSVKYIEGSVFYKSGIYNDASNWEDGVLYIDGHLIDAKEDISGVVTVKEGTKSIASSAFSLCSSISDVVIPEGVTVIMGNAFDWCSELKSVTMPASIECIKGRIFSEDDVTVICYKDSYAHKYALENNLSFEFICSGHEFTDYIDDNNATCTENGTKTAYCDKNCGTSNTVIIENSTLAHSFTNYETVKEVSCTEKGIKESYCDNGCGEKDTVVEEVLPHTPGEWIVIEESDYYNEGYKIQNCTVCSEVANHENIPMLVYEGFSDVWDGSWYDESVEYCFKHGYIMGTDKGYFEPNSSLTREQFVTILARISGAKLSEYTESTFTDVEADSWYGASVIWASENGYVKGIGNEMFGVGQSLNREQLATMFYRYAEKLGMDVSEKSDLSYCDDADSISDWASEACAWVIKVGLLGSTSETANLLSPKMTVTRAQAAKIFMSYDNINGAK